MNKSVKVKSKFIKGKQRTSSEESGYSESSRKQEGEGTMTNAMVIHTVIKKETALIEYSIKQNGHVHTL